VNNSNSTKDYNSIVWIQNIRSGWGHAKLKWLANIFSGGTPNTNVDEYWVNGTIPWLNSGSVNQKRITTASNHITELGLASSSAKWVPKGAILMALAGQGKTKGTVAILEIDATCNQSMASIIPNDEKMYNVYLFYWLELNYERIRGLAGTESRDGLNLGILGDIYCPVPSMQDQIQIALFLDHQCNIIEELIQKKERQVNLLQQLREATINEVVSMGLNPKVKFKNSGIEWLEKIPSHWEILKIKNIATAYGRIGYRGYTTEDIVGENEGAVTISPSNIAGDFMSFENCTYIKWEKYDESPEIQIYNNDILMVKTGSTYGKTGIVKNLSKKATINPQLLVFKNIKINPDYLFNLLRTPLIKNQVETCVIGSTIPTISQSKILNFQIVLPPINEIEEIMLFIRATTSQIDSISSLIKQQIDNLKEYRQSLISEAVTGKIDVREWQPSN